MRAAAQNLDELDRVVHQDRDAVAGTDARLDQRPGQSVHPPIDLGERAHLIAEPVRDEIGVDPRLPAELIGQRHPPRGIDQVLVERHGGCLANAEP